MQTEVGHGSGLTAECKVRFDKIEKWQDETDKRLEEGNKTMNSQETSIKVLITKMETLTDSIKFLARALWGAALFVGGTGIGFFIWYVQTH